MPELIAVMPLKYPHPIAVGERFTVDDSAARVLKMAGKARDASAAGGYATRKMDGEQSDDLLQPPRQKRKYQRRDMVSQD